MSKFLITMSTLCVLVVVGAWIMGGETGKYSTSISIDASPADVFPYLTDGEKISQWASDVVSVDSFDRDDSVIRKRVVQEEDETVTWEDSVLRFQDGTENENETEKEEREKEYSISIQSKNGGFTNTYFFHLKTNELERTNLEYRVTQTASGIDRFFFPFREDDTKAKITAEVTKLKSMIESEVEPMRAENSDLESDSMDDELGDSEPPVASDADNVNNTPAADFSITEMKGDVSPVETPVVKPLTEDEIEKPFVALKDRRFESLFATGR
jgi:uncharacterized protein YndB with AHSA1/START domain